VFCYEDGRMFSRWALDWWSSNVTQGAGIGHGHAHEDRHIAVLIMSSGRSVEVEAASAGLVEVAGLEAVGPVTFVILGREVVRTGAGDERFPDSSRVALVARTPGGGRDVHNVAQPLWFWTGAKLVLEAVRDARERLARPVAIRPALVTGDASLAGARAHAIHALQSAIAQYRTTLQR
jgi:hypothetical protein